MEDNKNNFNNFNRDNDPANSTNNDNAENASQAQSSESGSSYYYSYGPFKSINNEEANQDNGEHYNRREPERVEVTAPQPVKQLPYSTSLRTNGYDGNGGRGNSGGNGSTAETAGSTTASLRSLSKQYWFPSSPG